MRSSVGSSFNRIADNERGIVLILCLFMLLLLTLLGAFATSTSMTELSIAGNYRNAGTALNVADAGMQYAQTDSTIYNSINTTTPSWPAGAGTNPVTVGTNTAQVRVDAVLFGGAIPPGQIVAADLFQANYFAITSTGAGPNNSSARIEAQVAKIVPMPK